VEVNVSVSSGIYKEDVNVGIPWLSKQKWMANTIQYVFAINVDMVRRINGNRQT